MITHTVLTIALLRVLSLTMTLAEISDSIVQSVMSLAKFVLDHRILIVVNVPLATFGEPRLVPRLAELITLPDVLMTVPKESSMSILL